MRLLPWAALRSDSEQSHLISHSFPVVVSHLLQVSLPASQPQSRLLGGGGSPVESLQSHFILTMSHWSSGLPVCFSSQGTWVQNPWGDLSETGILLLPLSCYNVLENQSLCLFLAQWTLC